MTRQFNNMLTCPHCGGPVDPQSPFSKWIRVLPDGLSSKVFSNQNLDFIWMNYRKWWVITIEEKTRGGGNLESTSAKSQWEVHDIIRQMLQHANGIFVKTLWHNQQRMFYRGHYMVIFQNTNPEDSAWVRINGQHVTRQEFMEWLHTGSLKHVPGGRGFVAFDVRQIAA